MAVGIGGDVFFSLMEKQTGRRGIRFEARQAAGETVRGGGGFCYVRRSGYAWAEVAMA
jgi:hypothetical protein